MRIAVWHNLPSGGGKRALQYQVRELVRLGHFVKVWTPPTSCQTFADLRPYVEEVVVPLPQLNTHGGSIYRGRRDIALIVDRLDSMREHARMCAGQIKAENFDVLMGHPCLFFRASAIAGFSDLPSLMYLQEPYREFYEAWPELPWPARSTTVPALWPPSNLRNILRDWNQTYALRVQARAELDWMREFDAVAVNSSFSRESVLRAFGLESRVNYLGIDAELFKPAGVPKQPFVVGLGSITYNKGLERALAAVGAIEKSRRPKLVWIGNVSGSDYEKRIIEQAKKAEVDFSTRVMLSDPELVQVVSEAACMIYTSRLEPFGFAPLEANACGTPAVGIAEGGVRETIVNGVNGILVSSFDPSALGQAIASFTGDIEHATQTGVRARQHVLENWTWEKSGRELEAVLERTIQSGKA